MVAPGASIVWHVTVADTVRSVSDFEGDFDCDF